MNQPTVCHITTVHPFGDIRILNKECHTLAENGFLVKLIVSGNSNLHDDLVEVLPLGNLSKTRLLRLLKGHRKAYRLALTSGASFFHLHDPELLILGWRLKRKGFKVIYDSHEDLPRQIMSKHYIPSAVRSFTSRIVEYTENWFVRRISGVVAATPVIEKRFKKVNHNTISICNYPSLSEFNKDPSWDNPRHEICYVGGVFDVRGAFEMVNVLPLTNVKLKLAGTFSPTTLRNSLIILPGWAQVIEKGFVDRNEIKRILSHSLAGIQLLHPLKSYMDSLPVKMFEYMAAGIPVIASDFPMWKDIIEKNNCGICCNPLDLQNIASAINSLYSNQSRAAEMGRNGRRIVKERYNWENEKEKLISFYNKLLNIE